MPTDDAEGLVGSIVNGKYRINRVIGHGGMGAVYEAFQVGVGVQRRNAAAGLPRNVQLPGAGTGAVEQPVVSLLAG